MNMKQYDSRDVAKALIAIGLKHNMILNITKVQKLLYIIYGHFLAVEGIRICDEHPQAWPYGPVFPKTRKMMGIDGIAYRIEDLGELAADEMLLDVVENVVKTYAGYPASTLSEWSHEEGSPWDGTVSTKGFKWGNQIPDELIKSYFENFPVLEE
jgi:uncharacterized phage-associated protein